MKAHSNKSSKIYTKKQLKEAISYWKKQLAKGNYRKVNESIESEGARDDIETELAARNDIPNYLKAFIHDEVLEDAGHDGVGWHDWDLDGFVQDLLEDRIVEVDNMIWNDGDDDDSTVTRLNGLPLKFTSFNVQETLQKMFPSRNGLFPSGLSIKFPSYDLAFYWAEGGCFDDPQWREEIAAEGITPIELDSRGDASSLYDGYNHRIYTISADGVVH